MIIDIHTHYTTEPAALHRFRDQQLAGVADPARAPTATGLAALGISFAIPPTYTAKTQFLPPQQQQSAAASLLSSLGSLGGLAGAAAGIKNPGDQYISTSRV